MFNNLRLGVKIGLCFGVILVLLSVVLGVGIFSLQRADEGISDYRGLARETNLSGRLQANMLMLRMSVKDYLITNSEDSLQQYQEYVSKVHEFLEDAKQQINEPERAALVTDTAKAIATYESAFANVIDFTKERNVVEKTRLVPSGEKMRAIINNLIKSAYQNGIFVSAYDAGHVQEKMLLGRLFVVKFLQSNREDDFQLAVENMEKSLGAEIKDLYGSLQSPERIDMLREFEAAHNDYIKAMYDIHDLIVKRNGIIKNTLDALGPQVANNTEDMKLSVMKEQDALGPELKANTESSITFTVVLSAIAIVLGIISAYFLTIAITRPIQKAVDAANRLAVGDLTINVGSTNKDETGELLNAVQNTANNLKQIITTISNASGELASASEELAVITEQTSKGISQQETETEMVATAMNEMATTVRDVADNASKASDAANQADHEAKSGARVVEKTITSINALSQSVNHSAVKLDEVQKEVLNISSILEVITGIAEQTNLLALNAAIEAARAGEQGRGFAVVADEVRSLAARTQGSTSEIKSIIEHLQLGTRSAVEAMNQGKIQADNCVEEAKSASVALETITHVISVINDMNMQIASASEQQSTVAEDINKNVVNVKRIAEENAVASNQTSGSSSEIARLAENLGQMVTQFNV